MWIPAMFNTWRLGINVLIEKNKNKTTETVKTRGKSNKTKTINEISLEMVKKKKQTNLGQWELWKICVVGCWKNWRIKTMKSLSAIFNEIYVYVVQVLMKQCNMTEVYINKYNQSPLTWCYLQVLSIKWLLYNNVGIVIYYAGMKDFKI